MAEAVAVGRGRTAASYLLPEVAASIGRLDLRARGIAEGFLAGLHASPYHGFSVEFSDHRSYEPGDEPNSIDWAVYARSERLYIRRYRAETSTACHLVVDTSPSMGYGHGRISKLDYAIHLAAALAWLMVRQQDQVGLATFDDRLRTVIPPRSRRTHLDTLFAALAARRPAGLTDIPAALHQVAGLVRKRGFVIIFSDFLGDPAAILTALAHLRYRRHDLIAFHLVDPAERDLPFADPTRFRDLETGDLIEVDPQGIRSAYRRELGAHLDAIRSGCLRHGIDHHLVDTAAPYDRPLLAFLAARTARF